VSGAEESLAYVLGRAALVELRVRELVTTRRITDPSPDDPFRGLYLSEDSVDRLLGSDPDAPPAIQTDELTDLEDEAQRAADAGREPRLRRLARVAGLLPSDVELLVIGLLPDLDSRFERFYGYLNDDVTRRRASVGLALELAGMSGLDAAARARLEPARPLLRQGLLVVEDSERPFLTRALRVPDRVTAHLLGDDAPDATLDGLLLNVGGYPLVGTEIATRLATGMVAGVRLVHLREQVVGTGTSTAVAALAAAGFPAVVLDVSRLAGATDPQTVAALAVREALLQGAGLVVGPVEHLSDGHIDVVRWLTASDVPLFLVGTSTWDPRWSAGNPLAVEVPALAVQDRAELWNRELSAASLDGSADLDAGALASHLALGPAQVRRAVDAARISASLRDARINGDDLRRGVRAQNASGLERLARRIEPEVSWDDLVLTPIARRGLVDLAARARHRDQVLTEWRMRRGGGRGRGVVALFAGDSGTGKTMSAEVISGDLGLDLYTVNLATVVDKYVGETEKNLERIFVEATGVNAVLFFDEADAIFGKRSEVKDAHDRYANIESAYLLQRLETFDGLAVLATNLRANIDEAFTRRLDAIIDFPTPNVDLRRSLWSRCLAQPLPLAEDIDLDFLAGSFELTGGNIRSASITAAYLAAAAASSVGMLEVVAAVEQEYRKLGRLVLEREFGPFYAALG
jgi:hypothetical protein